MFFRIVFAVFLLIIIYTVSGASIAIDGNDSGKSTVNNSKEAIEDGSELSRASKLLNETSIIKLRDVSSQLQKLKANGSDNEPVVNQARNSTSRTSHVKLSDEKVGPCARTTCFTKNGTATCIPAADCTATKAETSVKVLKQTTMQAITARTPILDTLSNLPKKI